MERRPVGEDHEVLGRGLGTLLAWLVLTIWKPAWLHWRRETQQGFTEMRGKLDATTAGQQQIINLLNTLIATDDPETEQPS